MWIHLWPLLEYHLSFPSDYCSAAPVGFLLFWVLQWRSGLFCVLIGPLAFVGDSHGSDPFPPVFFLPAFPLLLPVGHTVTSQQYFTFVRPKFLAESCASEWLTIPSEGSSTHVSNGWFIITTSRGLHPLSQVYLRYTTFRCWFCPRIWMISCDYINIFTVMYNLHHLSEKNE